MQCIVCMFLNMHTMHSLKTNEFLKALFELISWFHMDKYMTVITDFYVWNMQRDDELEPVVYKSSGLYSDVCFLLLLQDEISKCKK